MNKKLFWQIVMLIIIFCFAMAATVAGTKYLLCPKSGGACPMKTSQVAK